MEPTSTTLYTALTCETDTTIVKEEYVTGDRADYHVSIPNQHSESSPSEYRLALGSTNPLQQVPPAVPAGLIAHEPAADRSHRLIIHGVTPPLPHTSSLDSCKLTDDRDCPCTHRLCYSSIRQTVQCVTCLHRQYPHRPCKTACPLRPAALSPPGRHSIRSRALYIAL